MHSIVVSYRGDLQRKSRDSRISKVAKRKIAHSGYNAQTRGREIVFKFRRLGPAINAFENISRQVRGINIELRTQKVDTAERA